MYAPSAFQRTSQADDPSKILLQFAASNTKCMQRVPSGEHQNFAERNFLQYAVALIEHFVDSSSFFIEINIVGCKFESSSVYMYCNTVLFGVGILKLGFKTHKKKKNKFFFIFCH